MGKVKPDSLTPTDKNLTFLMKTTLLPLSAVLVEIRKGVRNGLFAPPVKMCDWDDDRDRGP